VSDQRPRTHEIVLAHIEAELSAGRVSLGERLPGERVLAEQLGVSRASVREAIRGLEAMGVVRTAVGSGPDAGAVIVADPGPALAGTLRLHLATTHLLVADIVATRVLLESWAVRAAATSGPEASNGPARYADAERLLAEMDDGELGPADFHRLDAQFHVELARLSGNIVVAAMMAALRESIQGYVLAAVNDLPDWAGTSQELRREHRQILGALSGGAGARAAQLVTEHIEGFHRSAGLAGDLRVKRH
jgi:GntR family transcriptional regulator, transcriptional repressor for pyruvate dehydrogenase complex